MLKVFHHKYNKIEEIYPINGVYKVCELENYELKYFSEGLIISQDIFLEDILIDNSIFKFHQRAIISNKPERLFVDCFGFATLRINNESFNFNILIEKLKKDDIEEILLYLWKKDKSLYNIFLAKNSIYADYSSIDNIGLTSKFINYVRFFYQEMKNNFLVFKNLPHYMLRTKGALEKYNSNEITTDTLPWILDNLDMVYFSPELQYDNDAIDFNGNYGILDQIYIEKQYECYKVYENEIILGSFVRLLNKLNALKADVLKNIDIDEKYSNEYYVDFRDLKKIPYIRLLDEIEYLKFHIDELYSKYKNIFVDASPRLERPILTPVFVSSRHYGNAFKLIQNFWNIKFNFQGDILLLNIQKMSQLYEMYNFYLLIETLNNILFPSDFEFYVVDKNFLCYKRNKITINFFYEPIYFADKNSNLDLLRLDTQKGGTYYKPDFVIEINTPDKEKIYCVFDAKYSLFSTAQKRLGDCIYKYILNTGIRGNKSKKIDYLYILAPVDEKFNYVVKDNYYPQIGILPSKPSSTKYIEEFLIRLLQRIDY